LIAFHNVCKISRHFVFRDCFFVRFAFGYKTSATASANNRFIPSKSEWLKKSSGGDDLTWIGGAIKLALLESMIMNDIRNDIQEVFRDVFEDDTLELRDEMTAEDIADWDSVRHIDLIIALEKAMKIRFLTAEIGRLKQPGQNVGALIQLVEEKVKRR
jgi:acyl carrier protein